MNKKLDIKNPRFELVSSTLKGYKEVQVIFNCNGDNHKYFIFIKEDKKVNYINEAKRIFNEDIKSGKVLKSIKGNTTNPHPWLIATASVLGVAALTLAGLFTWKMVTNQDTPAPTPTETDYIVTFESNGGDHVDTKKVKPGTIISEPTITKKDYTFSGWYEKSDFTGNPFDFNTEINNDYTFYAKWTSEPVPSDFTSIIFDAGEGNKIEGSRKQTFKYYAEKGLTFGEIWKEIKYKGACKKNEDFLCWETEDGNPISVDYVIKDDVVNLTASYKPVKDGCLTITARCDNTKIVFFPMAASYIRYSLDGVTWKNPQQPSYSTNLNMGQQLYYHFTNSNTTPHQFYGSPDKPFSISGYVESDYNGVTEVDNDAFYDHFNDVTKPNLISAYNLNFGNIVLSDEYCCGYMFTNCTNLVEAPYELPSQTLQSGCYCGMFTGCSSLKSAPEIKADTLANYCFASMFEGCTSLKISEGNTGTKIFTCTEISGIEDPVTDMFKNCAGSFIDGTPTTGNTYCYY